MNPRYLLSFDNYRRVETPEERLKKLKNELNGKEKRLKELPKEIEKLKKEIAEMEEVNENTSKVPA